jgi:lysyl-tRNA synthetase class 1
VTAVQIASDFSGICEVLNRSGYDGYDEESVRRRVVNVRNWLTSYAPDSARFEVQEALPDAVKNLSDEQRAGLVELASRIQGGVAAKDMHDLVYAVAEETGIPVSKMFQAIYTSLLGKRSGPRAGYFMASLDREFLLDRLRAAGGENVGVDE